MRNMRTLINLLRNYKNMYMIMINSNIRPSKTLSKYFAKFVIKKKNNDQGWCFISVYILIKKKGNKMKIDFRKDKMSKIAKDVENRT